MGSIITITFSPCIDKSASIPKVIPEKKLKCSNVKLEPGGGGINVARAIKRLGGNATAIFPSGGYTGKFFNQLMQDEQIPYIVIETINETRENIIVFDESTNLQYRFGMPGSTLFNNEWKQCLNTIEKADNTEFIVASGSLPPGVPLDIYSSLAKIAKRKNTKLVVDASGEALKYAAKEEVYMLKPNLGELSSLVGKDWIEVEEIGQVAKEIIDKGICEVLVVSMGKAGALLMTKNECHRVYAPPIKTRSVVGAGDSMVGGMVWALSRKKKFRETLQYGVACGAAATLNPGTALCKKEDVEKLFLVIKNQSETGCRVR